jgi:hypothetical protein
MAVLGAAILGGVCATGHESRDVVDLFLGGGSMSGRAARAAKRRKALAKAPAYVYFVDYGYGVDWHYTQFQWIDANDAAVAQQSTGGV